KTGTPVIYGDGHQSRDFTYIANVVDANVRALEATGGNGQVMNVANGERVSLLELVDVMKTVTGRTDISVDFQPERKGDVKHSQADNNRAKEWLGYTKLVGLEEGIKRTIDWWKASRFAKE
ncbi:MAG: GDP-mannose 4,6-dehydratase, partial [bacterium]|nr:GDP-mannose 4,6-dehydratase [bacterium]